MAERISAGVAIARVELASIRRNRTLLFINSPQAEPDQRCPNLLRNFRPVKALPESDRASACIRGSNAMLRRLRFKNTTLEELLVEEAQLLREEAQSIPPGRERLIRHARRAKTASHL